jgi:ammonium transporter Rh
MTDGIMASRGWETLFFLSQATMIVFFCVGVTFEDGAHSHTTSPDIFEKQQTDATAMMTAYYPMWMDIHVMIFIGFGFLMVFLKHHSWSSVGFNYLIGAWAIQCGIVF